MGERPDEICTVLQDLRAAGCDVVTIGKYLQPTKGHVPVVRYYEPAEFVRSPNPRPWPWALPMSESSPLTRSSYHAAQGMLRCKSFT